MSNKKVPFGATCLTADFSVKRDKPENKTAKVNLLARTGDKINHWYWGSVVHDLSGMRLHKNRITLDWNHNPDQLVGYANKFDSSTGDLMASGAITPTRENDMADQIIKWSEAEIPLEASISFADDMLIEEFGSNEIVSVNNREFIGPITVIREWGLRSIAVCPWGADKNTATNLFNNQNSEVTVRVLKRGVAEMSTDAETVVEVVEAETELAAEAVVEAVETVEVTESVEAEAETENAEEETETEVDVTAETVVMSAVVPEEEVTVETVAEVPVVETVLSSESDERKLFKSFVTEFGAELAATYFAEGKDMNAAKDSYLTFLKQENAILRAQATESLGESAPVSTGEVAQLSADRALVAKGVMAGLTEGQAQYAAQLKIKK